MEDTRRSYDDLAEAYAGQIATARSAGLRLVARLDREAYPDAEHPSRRSSLLLQA